MALKFLSFDEKEVKRVLNSSFYKTVPLILANLQGHP